MSSKPGAAGYLMENDNKTPHLAVLFVQPVSESQGMEFVAPLTDAIRAEAKKISARYPGFETVVTGMPALTTDEMRLVARDCLLASVVAGLGVLLVFMLMFRSVRVSIFLVLPLGLGLVWAAGFTGAMYGHLTLITSYFAAVLFGLGVAYTIHIVGRFHEALLDGKEKTEAVRLSITGAGPGVFVAGSTTALAFFAIACSEFQGFAEMGIVSGVGTLIVLFANLTLLPAALVLWHPGLALASLQVARSGFWVRIQSSRFVVPSVAVLACLAGFALAPQIGFDYAVESMLPANAEAVRGMRLLDERTEFSTTYSVAVAGSLAESDELRRKLEKLPTVSRAESLSMFFPANQAERLSQVKKIDQAVGDKMRQAKQAIDELGKPQTPSTPAEVGASLMVVADALEDMAFDAKRAERKEAASLQRLAERARTSAERVAKEGVSDRVADLEARIFEGISEGLRIVVEALADQGFEMKDLPPAIRGRYLGKDDTSYAVIVFPKGDVGDRDFLMAHVDDLMSVSPGATGHAVTHKEFTRMVLDGFRDAVILSIFAVLILVLLDLRRPADIALALTPVIIGAGCTALAMYLLDLRFNYANLLAVPILIGTGVDYGAHLAHRRKQEGSLSKAAETTGRAVALTGLTTLIGFGSLCLGNHWGVRSLGILLVISISFSLIAAIVVLPSLVSAKGE
jgi:hopanoid biosynthesis associated RND transporter like protein HpnN